MDSWRDTASQQVDDDFEALFDVTMPWAIRSRSRYRNMVPFGASVAFVVDTRLPNAGTDALRFHLAVRRADRVEMR